MTSISLSDPIFLSMHSSPSRDQGVRPPALPCLAPGTLIDGRYRIIHRIGDGGFATVYRARHIRLDTDIAIKVLSHRFVGLTRHTIEERFLDEARAAASVAHPNVVRVLDHGIMADGDRAFIAMELLQGHDLKEELRLRRAMEPRRAVKLTLGALDALGAAHCQGIIHKDLKPANLFLRQPMSAMESLVVMDFGVARTERSGRRTGSGQILGTPQYMAPEYITQQRVSPSLDVYQMGLIFVEMLTGRPAVSTSNMLAALDAHRQGRLAIPEWIVRSPLAEVVRRATARSIHDRYPDAAAFRDELAAIDPAELDRVRRLERVSYTPTVMAQAPTAAPPAEAPAAPSQARDDAAAWLSASFKLARRCGEDPRLVGAALVAVLVVSAVPFMRPLVDSAPVIERRLGAAPVAGPLASRMPSPGTLTRAHGGLGGVAQGIGEAVAAQRGAVIEASGRVQGQPMARCGRSPLRSGARGGVTVRLDASQVGAEVRVDGALVGVTPCEATLRRSARPAVVQMSLPGADLQARTELALDRDREVSR